MKKLICVLRWIMMAIPVALGVYALVEESYLWLFVAAVSVFVSIALNPECRGMEEIWVFVLSFFTLLPYTFKFQFWVFQIQLSGDWMDIVFKTWILFQYLLVFMSLEIIVMMAVGKFLWPKKNNFQPE